ncbi:phage protein [Streptococcus parauberis KCTC 11537]|nr:phage protein [Streptococcus parauberis KCTC 11537]
MSKSIGESSEKLRNFGDKMSGVGEKIADVGSNMTKWITTPIVGAVGYAVKAYADLEQAVGGVETLFKSSSKEVISNAEKAYKTAGISSVKYMEQVTSFSASLLQGLGGDTAKAAKVADKAIIDMSDNANRMGTSMEEIQHAYQNFAKGNFTMLDSLKLGFGGSKQEMQRLLEKAEELTGIKYDINNFSDIIEAIHVIQTELGITGTTAKEAESTISGSFNQMLSSLNNLSAGFGDKNADIKKLMNELEQSTKTFVTNVSNVLKTIWDNLPLEPWQKWTIAVVALAGPVLLVFGPFIVGIGNLITAFGTIGGVISGIAGWFGALTAEGGALAGVFGSLGAGPIIAIFAGIALAIGLVALAIKDLWTNSEAFRIAVTEIWTSISTMLTNVWNSFILPVFQAIKEIIMSIVEESLIPLYNSFKEMLTNIALELSSFLKIAEPFISTLADLFGKIIPPILEILGAKFKGVFAIISNVMTVSFQTISGIVKNLLKVLGGIITFITGVFTGNWRKAWQGIVDMLGGIFGGIGSIMKGAMNGVIGIINGAISGINSLIGTVNKIPGLGDIGTISAIPYLARGTDNWQGGFARMNEGGRGELAYMPSGMVVVPHDVSMKYAKESARAQSGVVSVNNSESIALEYLKVAKKALERPNVLRVNGRDLAYTTGSDFTNYQNNQAIQIKRLRGEV